MKTLIAILALTLLIVPMLAGIRRMRRLPPSRATSGMRGAHDKAA